MGAPRRGLPRRMHVAWASVIGCAHAPWTIGRADSAMRPEGRCGRRWAPWGVFEGAAASVAPFSGPRSVPSRALWRSGRVRRARCMLPCPARRARRPTDAPRGDKVNVCGASVCPSMRPPSPCSCALSVAGSHLPPAEHDDAWKSDKRAWRTEARTGRACAIMNAFAPPSALPLRRIGP